MHGKVVAILPELARRRYAPFFVGSFQKALEILMETGTDLCAYRGDEEVHPTKILVNVLNTMVRCNRAVISRDESVYIGWFSSFQMEPDDMDAVWVLVRCTRIEFSYDAPSRFPSDNLFEEQRPSHDE